MRTSSIMLRRAAVAATLPLLLALLVGGVGSAAPAGAQEATATPGPSGVVISPSPTSSPTTEPAPVTVSHADSGRTVRLVPGQDLVVELTAPQGEQWQGPQTVGPLYLLQYAERAERTRARLEALRPSRDPVVLRARTDRACFHSNDPCPQAFSEWSLSVVVDDGPAPDAAYPCVPRAPASPAPGVTYLDEGDSGRRIQVEVGAPVYVSLSSCTDHYTVPSAGSGPLWRENADAIAVGLAAATFRGLRPGSGQIVAQTDPPCAHTAQPCLRPAQVWSVDVEVVAADGTCSLVPTVQLDRSTIIATGTAGLTVSGTAGAAVELWAYTQPSTDFRKVRTGTLGSDGTLRFSIRPPANTRLYAQEVGCAAGPSTVLNVGTALTLAVERVATRTYVFSGDSLPARPGGLVVSLYRVAADGREVLTAQVRADAVDGQWQLQRRFTGTGRFGFLVRTGQDLQNAPGRSNLRTVLVF